MLGEFEQIAQIMAPLAASAKGAFALTDDAATFTAPEGHEIVVTTDTLIAGVHFFADDPAQSIAHKLLGVNLSDLASMGAKPLYYTLNASYPDTITLDWIKEFSGGLAQMQDRYSITLLGGDTTHTPGPLTLSLSAFGCVETGTALRRTLNRAGELICVSGTIGDGALGLLAAQNMLEDDNGYLLTRYRCPQPRTQLGMALRGLATSCMDISDGLLGDLFHMTEGAEIYLDKIPLSDAADIALQKDSSLVETILTGGDDYELLFTVNPQDKEKLEELSLKTNTNISVIGRITDVSEISVYGLDGKKLEIKTQGYRHF